MTEGHVEQSIGRARRVNRRRDEDERRCGISPPSACPADVQVRTVLAALRAAMLSDDWDVVAEAYAMLEDMHDQLPLTVGGGVI